MAKIAELIQIAGSDIWLLNRSNLILLSTHCYTHAHATRGAVSLAVSSTVRGGGWCGARVVVKLIEKCAETNPNWIVRFRARARSSHCPKLGSWVALGTLHTCAMKREARV
jgi:hypothetical protein